MHRYGSGSWVLHFTECFAAGWFVDPIKLQEINDVGFLTQSTLAFDRLSRFIAFLECL